MLHIGFGAGAKATSRYVSGSTKMMRLLAAQAPQHWFTFTLTHATHPRFPRDKGALCTWKTKNRQAFAHFIPN
jgi:hypothetical protein